MQEAEAPHFFIITPTYKRDALLLRAIESVANQKYENYTHIIINDNGAPLDVGILKKIQQQKNIFYIDNKKNEGKNKSLNKAIVAIGECFSSEKHSYIIFLDDDDWLSPESLNKLALKIHHNPRQWIVARRDVHNKIPLTIRNRNWNTFSYSRDYLLFKIFQGDATHCIPYQRTKHIFFPNSIKTGEEWLYFSSIEKTLGRFVFMDYGCTLTDGYLPHGVTTNYAPPAYAIIVKEIMERKLLRPAIMLYIIGRKIKTLVRNMSNAFK